MTPVDYDLNGKRVFVAGHRGLVGSALTRRLQRENCQILTATRAELDLVLNEASQVVGQPITPEFMKKSNELLIKRVEAFLALNKTELQILVEANRTTPDLVKEEEFS